MLFFVRRADGFLPMEKVAGSVICPEDLAVPMVNPTKEQMETLGVERIKGLHKMMGFVLRKGSRSSKERFVQFALNDWDDTTAHGLTIRGNYGAYHQAGRKLFFYKTDDTFFMPFMIGKGGIIRQETFNETTPYTLDMSMVNSLTIQQLVEFQVAMGIDASDAKDGKSRIATRTLGSWQWHYARFVEEHVENKAESEEETAETDSEDGTIPVLDDESDYSDGEDIDDDDIAKLIEQFDNITPEDFKFYTKSPVDFFKHPMDIKVFTFKGNAPMFSVTADHLATTGLELKQEVLRHVKFFAKKHGNENAWALDSFILTDGIKTIEDNKVINCHVTENVYVVLCLKGGAPAGVIKTIVKSKTSDKTSQADLLKFQGAFNHASSLTNSSVENVTGIFKNLSAETLAKMKDYVEHDRTPSKMKPAGLASMLPPIAEMEEVRGKLNTAIEDAKALTVAFFQQTCGDGNDGVKMAKVTRMIETRIGVLEELAKSAPVAVAKSPPPTGAPVDVQMRT
eukprot:Skav218841  [mRNA]  locus=scaffold3958:8826:10355:- [translate_table: standard]